MITNLLTGVFRRGNLVGLSVLLCCVLIWGMGYAQPQTVTTYPTGQWCKLYSSFHVGGTYPFGDLDSLSDSNVHFRIDVSYRMSEKFFLMFMAGLNQFTTEGTYSIEHPRWFNISTNAVFFWGGLLKHYIQAGPGYYKPKTGAWDPGFNVGVGAMIPFTATPFWLKFGIDGHFIRDDKIWTRFLTYQIGVLFCRK